MKALLVVFFVSTSEAAHPATVAAIRATREALGTDRDVEVRSLDNLVTDERALAAGNALHASTVVELFWEGSGHRQARLRLHLDPRGAWQERVLGFQDADDLEERGRTIGYAVASMIPDADPARERTAIPDDVPLGPPPVTSRTTWLPSRPTEPSLPPPPRSAGGPAANLAKRGAVDVVGSAATGIKGDATGIGGGASARLDLRGPLALRFGLSARSGQVTTAQATSLLMHASAGLALTPLQATQAHRWEFGGRVSGLLMREQLSHFDGDDRQADVMSRWLPGLDFALETAWFFSNSAAFLGSLGAEVAFGKTDVTIHQVNVASVPPLRMVLQLGVRAGF